MILESLIPSYYSDVWDCDWEWFDRFLYTKKVEACKHFPLEEMIPRGGFHDYYVTNISLYSAKDSKVLDLCLQKRGEIYHLVLENISFLEFVGEILSDSVLFPPPSNKKISPIAQVLSIWFAYDKQLECIVLLDCRRYIKVCAGSVRIEGNSES